MFVLKLILFFIFIFVLYPFTKFLEYCFKSSENTENVLSIDLNSTQLEWLLHARGISCDHTPYKDLIRLVSLSGIVSKNELKTAEYQNSYHSSDSSLFSTFLEVEAFFSDSNDIWLVQLIDRHHHLLMDTKEWLKLSKTARVAGLRTLLISCKRTPSICLHKESSFILLKHFIRKGDSFLDQKDYLINKTDFTSAFKWLSDILKSSTEEIVSLEDLKRSWLSDHSRKLHATQLIYVSELDRVPLFFAALQLRFKTRIRFGNLLLKNETQSSDLSKLLQVGTNLPKSFVCFIVNREIFLYGNDSNSENYLHFHSLHLFLLTFNPGIDQVFTWSVCVCSVLALLSYVTTSGDAFSRFLSVIYSLFFYNSVLILLLVVLSSFQLPAHCEIAQFCLHCVQHFAFSPYAHYMRQYILQLTLFNFFFFTVTFFIFFWFVFSVMSRYGLVKAKKSNVSLSGLLLLDQNQVFVFNDMTAHWDRVDRRPVADLQPQISTDYVRNLPVWKYTGRHIETSGESNEASANIPPEPSPFIPREFFHTRNSGEIFFRRFFRSCLRNLIFWFKHTPGPSPGMFIECSCSICLEDYDLGSHLCGLPCGHVFHHDCILQWLSLSKHSCPNCRHPANKPKKETTV